MPNPRYQIQDWLTKYAERRKLRCQVELADTSEHHVTYFVVGGVGVRDEVLVMFRLPAYWWPVWLSVRGSEAVECIDERAVDKFLEGVE